MTVCLVQIDGYDPVAAAAVTLYASSHDDDRVCQINGQTWYPAIFRLPALRYDLVDAGFSGRIETPGSSLSLAVEAWPSFARYALADARLRLWTGDAGGDWASYTLRFDGRVTSQPSVAEGLASLSFAVDDRWLDTPLLTLYAGTTGAEGPAALKGQPKPLALGAPRYCPATLIDPTNNVFQLSAYGLIEDVETAFERLLAFEASAGDHASYAALVAAAIPPGKWASAKAVGMVRHGAPLAGKACYHVKGDKAGADGWVRLPGSVIRRIALLAGGTGKTHDASLYALNSSRPWNVSWHIRDQISAREAIQRIAASVNAVAGVSWLGQLFVAPLPSLSGTATITLDSSGTTLPPVGYVRQIEIDPPYWRMAIEAERTELVHSYEEIAGLYIDRGPYVATESYRENHIVQHQGMSWVYIGAAASTGNVPPTLPTTINAWWRAMDSRLGGIETGATVGRNIGFGPPEIAVPYDYLGTTTDGLPRDYSWKLYKNGVEITSGVTWTYAVTQGTFNTFTLASGSKTMSGTGVGTLTASSLGTNEATLLVKAVHEGVTTQLAVKFRKDIAAAPTSGGSGGTTTLNSKTSGFGDISSSAAYVDVTGALPVTIPAGKTAVSVSINLDYFPDSGANGNWTLRLKLQRSIASVWTDVGSPATLTAAVTSAWNSADGGGEYGNVTGTIAETGLTAGASYDYRVVGQLTSGTRNHTLTGGAGKGVVVTA